MVSFGPLWDNRDYRSRNTLSNQAAIKHGNQMALVLMDGIAGLDDGASKAGAPGGHGRPCGSEPGKPDQKDLNC